MGKRKRKRPKQVSQLGPSAAVGARGTIRLGLVLAVLVAVNIYVFFIREGTSIPAVKRASVNAPAADAGPAAPPAEAGRRVKGAVQASDSLGKILRREGLAQPEADALIRALSPVMDLRKIRAGQSYRLHLDDTGLLLVFEFDVSDSITVRADRAADGVVVATIEQRE